MSYVDPKTITDLDVVRERLAMLRKLKRETQWRGEDYRYMVMIEELKARRTELRQEMKKAVA